MDSGRHALDAVNDSTYDGLSVHSGFPNAAADNRLTGLDLNKLLVKNPRSTFFFRVRGEQGLSRGIFDGDIAAIDRSRPIKNDDLILWHDGESFKLSGKRTIPPDCTAWGVVIAVIRQFHAAEKTS